MSFNSQRNVSVDFVRGLVMLLMVLGHTRILGMQLPYTPVNLEFASEGLFLTRWITHIVAPAFVVLTGLGSMLRLQAGKPRQAVSWFLFTRGLWLVFLEFTVVHYGWHFDYAALLFLQIIWVQGISMVLLSLFLYAPKPTLWSLAALILIAHNLFDGVAAEAFGPYEGLYRLLRGTGLISWAGGEVYVEYPVLPWFALMLCGFLLGDLYRLDASRRQRLMIRIGLSMLVALLVLRLINGYGNPDPWSMQTTAFRTLLSFFNAERYPPSLMYVLMTLGPLVIALALLERLDFKDNNPICVFGRVPLFFYLVHLYLAHGLMVLIRTYFSATWQYSPDFGLSLSKTYLAWAMVVIFLYPMCYWYDRVKRQRRYPLLSYL